MAWKRRFISFIVTVDECWIAWSMVVEGGSVSQARSMLVSVAVFSVVRRVWAAEMERSMRLSLKCLMKMACGLTKHDVRIWCKRERASAMLWSRRLLCVVMEL
jgi:hypothetical protein